jgi:hypothetical protein
MFCILTIGFFGCDKYEKDKYYIAENVSLFDPNVISDFIAGQKLDKQQVLDSLNGMQNAFRSSYIGYSIKKDLTGLSGDEVFKNCRAIVAQGKEQLTTFDYYDVVLQCLASFKDTHLYFTRTITPSTITSAISEARLVEGKLYVSRIRPGLIEKIEEIKQLPKGAIAEKLKLGIEILRINNQEPHFEIDKLKLLEGRSSDLASTYDAVGGLFTRKFSYPDSSGFTLTLKQADGTNYELELPWVQISTQNSSLQSRVILSGRGIIKTADISDTPQFMKSVGADTTRPLFDDIANQNTYYDEGNEQGTEALQTGIVKLNNSNFCYLKLNTFNLESDNDLDFKVYSKVAEKYYPLDGMKVIKNFLKSCEVFNTSLVLDLRNNGGGDSNFANAFFNAFENEMTLKSYPAKAQLLQKGNQSFINASLDTLDSNRISLSRKLMFNALVDAQKRANLITDWVLLSDIENERKVYSRPVYLLVTPDCVSACDITANKFKKTARAILIGEPANGTGFGFTSSNKGKTAYSDYLNMLAMDIPNFAFGTAIVKDDSDFISEGGYKGSALPLSQLTIMENNATYPDYLVPYTKADLFENYKDYLNRLSAIIGEKESSVSSGIGKQQ